MENKSQIQFHRAWIISLLCLVLYATVFQYWMYMMWTGKGTYSAWIICTVALFAIPSFGLRFAKLFVLRNKFLLPPWRQFVVPILTLSLVLGNGLCLGYMVLFLGYAIFRNIDRLANEVFIKIFGF